MTTVVTGASAGLGRAIAQKFAERGDRVALIARDPERLESAAKEIDAAGGTALAVPVDVADARAVVEAADHIETELGPIDVWVNDAMTSVFAPFWSIDADEYERVTAVSYLGCVNGTRAALEHMRPRNRGTIVQVGSALAYRGIPLQSAYCGSKHAIKGFTESVRCELLHEQSDVRITMVQMPALNTPQFDWCRSKMPRRAQPVPPIFQPEVGADMVVHATEHYRREYWVTFSTVRAIVGERFAAGVLDRMLGRTGFDAQQTDEPDAHDRPDNLWQPVPGDFRAHGRFSSRARSRSGATAFAKYRDALTANTGLSRVGDRVLRGLAAALAKVS